MSLYRVSIERKHHLFHQSGHAPQLPYTTFGTRSVMVGATFAVALQRRAMLQKSHTSMWEVDTFSTRDGDLLYACVQ
jgi:hypothetical protein